MLDRLPDDLQVQAIGFLDCRSVARLLSLDRRMHATCRAIEQERHDELAAKAKSIGYSCRLHIDTFKPFPAQFRHLERSGRPSGHFQMPLLLNLLSLEKGMSTLLPMPLSLSLHWLTRLAGWSGSTGLVVKNTCPLCFKPILPSSSRSTGYEPMPSCNRDDCFLWDDWDAGFFWGFSSAELETFPFFQGNRLAHDDLVALRRHLPIVPLEGKEQQVEIDIPLMGPHGASCRLDKYKKHLPDWVKVAVCPDMSLSEVGDETSRVHIHYVGHSAANVACDSRPRVPPPTTSRHLTQ